MRSITIILATIALSSSAMADKFDDAATAYLTDADLAALDDAEKQTVKSALPVILRACSGLMINEPSLKLEVRTIDFGDYGWDYTAKGAPEIWSKAFTYDFRVDDPGTSGRLSLNEVIPVRVSMDPPGLVAEKRIGSIMCWLDEPEGYKDVPDLKGL